jgi:hypothetical protein
LNIPGIIARSGVPIWFPLDCVHLSIDKQVSYRSCCINLPPDIGTVDILPLQHTRLNVVILPGFLENCSYILDIRQRKTLNGDTLPPKMRR